jgi:hypothetical protein
MRDARGWLDGASGGRSLASLGQRRPERHVSTQQLHETTGARLARATYHDGARDGVGAAPAQDHHPARAVAYGILQLATVVHVAHILGSQREACAAQRVSSLAVSCSCCPGGWGGERCSPASDARPHEAAGPSPVRRRGSGTVGSLEVTTDCAAAGGGRLCWCSETTLPHLELR